LEVRQAARADLEAARAERKTFKDAAAGWRELINKKPRAEKTRDRDERMISYLTGAFGNKPIDEVEAKDLIDLLETFEDNESYETRARLQAAALNIGGYAHGKAWIEHNPFLHCLRQSLHLTDQPAAPGHHRGRAVRTVVARCRRLFWTAGQPCAQGARPARADLRSPGHGDPSRVG
jgi:integrase